MISVYRHPFRRCARPWHARRGTTWLHCGELARTVRPLPAICGNIHHSFSEKQRDSDPAERQDLSVWTSTTAD